MATLVNSPELLLDIIDAYAKQVPAARLLGGQFTADGLKRNKQYTAHIAGLPTAENVTSTYAVTGNDADTLISDVPVTISKRMGVRLYWQNLNAISQDKNEYAKHVRNAGYVLGKAFMDDLLTEVTAARFSQASEFSTANSDVDAIADLTSGLNSKGALGTGRVLIVNSDVAKTLSVDPYFVSRDYAGQIQGGNGYRTWRNVHGFELIQEYPDMPTNNGTALTSVSCANTGDLFTKASHGLETGDRVYITGFSAGITAGTYFVIYASSSTFQLASSVSDAIAGTAVAVTADGTGGTVTQTEAVTGFATDLTGINFLAGPEDHSDQQAMMAAMNIPNVIDFETVTHPEHGISMSLVKYQDAGTGNITWMPVLLWGKVAGRQAGANAVGSYADYGGRILRLPAA